MSTARRRTAGRLTVGRLTACLVGSGLALAAVAGCSAASPSTTASSPALADGAAKASAAAGNGPATGAATSAASPSSGPPSQNVDTLDKPPDQTGRQIVSTATMTVQVDDVVAAKQKAAALVTSLEPSNELFAEQTNLSTASGASPSSTVTFKVAPAKFTEVLDDLAGLGKLGAQEVKTDDVTQQVVDLDARVKAAEQSTARVADLVARTTSLPELAQLENEVQRRQADLESLRGQQRTLAARTDLATVVLTLTTVVPPPIPAEATTKPLPGFLDGLHGGWEAFTNVVTVVAAVLGAVLPFSWLVLVAAVAWRFSRRRRPAPPVAPAGS